MSIYHKFDTNNPQEVMFFFNNKSIAIGEYTGEEFVLLQDEGPTKSFTNAMQAFSFLKSIYSPSIASRETMDLIEKPSRPIDNLSKYKQNNILAGLGADVLFAKPYK